MKAIVFATKTGGGHMSAANALVHALNIRGCDAKVCDFLTLTGKRTSDIVGNAYINLVRKSPRAFGKIYRVGQFISTPRFKSIVYFANTLYSSKLTDYIRSEAPDVILTTHIFAAQALTHLGNLHIDLPPIIGIMTDYTCAPFWEETELDAYITPHPLLYNEFSQKLPNRKLYPLGIPVDPACVEYKDIAAAKLAQGLEPDKKHLLIIGGSMGAGNLPEVVDALSDTDAQISVVCGNNKKLYDNLSLRFNDSGHIHIYGFVSPLFPLMSSADIILSKSGGLTSTEIMTMRKPFIVINPIEGVENRNAEFFESLGAAAYARTNKDIGIYVQKLLTDENAKNSMLAAQKSNIHESASGDIADFAIVCSDKEQIL